MTTAVIGSGLISLPLATYNSGIILTLIQIILSAFLCVYSNMLLVIFIFKIDCSIYTKKNNYMSLAEYCLKGLGLKIM